MSNFTSKSGIPTIYEIKTHPLNFQLGHSPLSHSNPSPSHKSPGRFANISFKSWLYLQLAKGQSSPRIIWRHAFWEAAILASRGLFLFWPRFLASSLGVSVLGMMGERMGGRSFTRYWDRTWTRYGSCFCCDVVFVSLDRTWLSLVLSLLVELLLETDSAVAGEVEVLSLLMVDVL